jgi:hypothetical protein
MKEKSLKIEIVEENLYFKKGTQKNVPNSIARELIKNGVAKAVVKEQPKTRTAKKQD